MIDVIGTDWLYPDWPAPATVRALTTTRSGGISAGSYASFNLATHVGDDARAVAENRRRLREVAGLPAEPTWLDQVHGRKVVLLDQETSPGMPADAAVTREPGVVCAVLTADCLPLLMCDRAGSCVASAHAGWRGLIGGVVESTVDAMGVALRDIMVWLGPAIGPNAFEVGDEVRDAFLSGDPAVTGAFRPSPAGRWLADLYALARLRLEAMGVVEIYGGAHCTFLESETFYSYRRDGVTGRMASMIWLDKR
nr:peptidoglycan editing factor PgeF [Acidihalobacter aeolianus]